MLNVLYAKHLSAWAPSLEAQQKSVLFEPLRAFAPAVIPALGETKWVKRAIDQVKAGVEDLTTD